MLNNAMGPFLRRNKLIFSPMAPMRIRIFSQELKWKHLLVLNRTSKKGKGDYFVVYKKTVGITPLYPKTTTLELVTNTSSPRTDSTFFGKERCNFYEKQVAAEAFEYVF